MKCEICEKILSVLREPLSSLGGMITLGSGREVIQHSQCKDHQQLVTCALGPDFSRFLAETPTIAEKIDLIQIHKSPANAGAIITAKIPDHPQIPKSLSALYIVKNADSNESYIKGQILHPQWIDSNLPRLWKTTCDSLHKGICKNFSNEIQCGINPVWLVDVWQQCVVKAPKHCSYVALSYVWGDYTTLKATCNNICQLQKQGSLSTSQAATPIARTIRDSMGIVQLLEERYLWVDTLCIVQDDELHKYVELAKMAAIFANASITILAVQGENANSGLRGFREVSQPRHIEQIIHWLGNDVQVAQYPLQVDGGKIELATCKSVWKTRGWTYQEHLFARRKLIFDGDSLRWECAVSTWREHTEFSHELEPWWDIYDLFESSIPDLRVFTTILHKYNIRSFTYPEDALNAFSGIASALSASFDGGFVSGLPTALFDLALLWLPYEELERRTARYAQRQHCLPSWSWAGWSGRINMELATDFIRNSPKNFGSKMQRVVRLTSWKYHETLEAPGKRIHASIFDHRQSYLGNQKQCPSGWTRHPISESLKAFNDAPDPRSPPSWFYRNTRHPEFDFWYPIPLPNVGDSFPSVQAPYISCKTQRAWLSAAEKILPNNGYRPTISLRDHAGIWAGVLLPHEKLSMFSKPHEMPAGSIELVEVALGLCRDTTSPWPGLIEIKHHDRIKKGQWYEYYWVMWVEWLEGVAYRKGLGRVCKDVWESQERESVDLMLA